MSKIKIFGLGGLDEEGKNAYVIEVDNSIFIMDCGLKYSSNTLLGIDYIIPDFSYLVENKKKIKGLFLTHGHKESMGAVKDLLGEIPDIKIYATKFTKFTLVEEGINPNKITEIDIHKKISFGTFLSVFPIAVSHSVPDSVMYAINTKDGAICYTGDFVIDPSMSMDLGKIAYVGKQGVLCLMSESSFSENEGFTSPNHRLLDFFKNTVNKNPKRIIFSVSPEHLHSINEIFEALNNKHRKVILMGKKLQNLVKFASENNYITVPNNLIGSLDNINDENSVVFVANDRTNPYYNLNKILSGYDKFIKLKEDDTVVFADDRHDATEKLLVKLQNALAKEGCNIVDIPKDKITSHHASKEDLMLMYKLMNPKYYMPVRGEYRYMVNNANIATSLGMSPDNIILKQNGESISIENKTLLPKFEKIKVGDILIDGTSSDDVGHLVIKDREMLSESGIIIVSATLSRKTKKLLVGPVISTRGFIYNKYSNDFISELEEMASDVITRNIHNNNVDYGKIKSDIRNDLGKYLFKSTECKPMIIAVVQEV